MYIIKLMAFELDVIWSLILYAFIDPGRLFYRKIGHNPGGLGGLWESPGGPL